jgi:outer membrane receptor protein involved in Fe transport
MGAQSMVAAAVFFKQVTDHIYTAFESSSQDNAGISNEFQIPGGVIAKKFQNAPTAYAAGIELSFNSKFKALPGQLKHFGINANYSYTHARMQIEARDAAQALPRQSPNVANLALFFENGIITARAGLNYRDPYLYELNLYAVKDPASEAMIVEHQDNEYDTYIGKSLTVDASLSWRFRPHFSAFAEANNLTNTPYLRYRGRIERPVKTEYYSVRGLVGIRFEL